MVDISDSSFSSYVEEDSNDDSQDESFYYETFIENEILVDFGDDHTEINEIAEIEDSQDGGAITGGETQILARSKTSADVWKYFTRKETTIRNENDEEIINQFIFCNVGECHLSINNSTSTLERHLKAKHYDAYLELYEQKIITELWPKEKQEAKHEFLVNWIIIDQQPFTIVDNLSFRKFMLSVQPRYKLPTRSTLKDMILSKFKTAREEICNHLQLSISKVSLTMDMWTSISALGILAVTVHYINDSWQFKHFVLDVLYIPSPHDSLTIKDSVLKITDEFEISNRLVGITTDNEAKMIAATRKIGEDLELSDFQHYRCMAHILNLVVKAALETNNIPSPIKKLRIFISTVRNSPKQMDKLKEYFRIENIPFKIPLPDIITRWNYTYHMIERAIEIKPLLNHLVANLPILTNNWPTSEEWSILNNLLDLLAPFALTTKVISASSYPTIGEVKWYFLGIKNHLERSRDSNYSLQSQIDEMKIVFNNYFDQINQLLHIPAFFDPRYKNSAYGRMSRENILQPIQSAMDNYKESTIPITEDETVQDLRYQLKNLSTSETRNYFQNLFMPDDQSSQSIANELDTYFDINSPNFETSPLDWWKVHESEYPTLAQMAKDYLTIMSTSVPCEQLFSIAGKQITQTRNRLHPDTTQACLCLKSWLEQEIIK
jgi:hypothetical protein